MTGAALPAGADSVVMVEHTVVAALSRISRFGIEFVDLSGASGADVYLYVVVGAIVATVVVVSKRTRHVSAFSALTAGALLLCIAAQHRELRSVTMFSCLQYSGPVG